MKTIRLHPAGHEVKCGAGETVLMALENAGYALPNNCRAGACGDCKVKVLSGRFDQGIVLDMALSQEDRKQGFGLMCMAKPLSDELVLEWGSEQAKLNLFPPQTNQIYVVTDRIRRTGRIVELRLRPLGPPMRYWPGQYVLLGDPEGRIPPRCYSLASAPKPDGELTLQITRVEDGKASSWAHDQLRVGESVSVSGPYGTFIGDPSVETPVLCIAAGSGLAPILSLADAALRRGFRQPVTLMFSARTLDDLYESGLFEYWTKKYVNFRYIPTLTRDTHGGLTGRIPDVLPKQFKDLSNYSVFIAGSPTFVDACALAAKRLGASERFIYTEGYYAQVHACAPASVVSQTTVAA
ncbi:Ferredoxin:oxidoreductase FAD/NAD(P)-binding:oxidoreductase FAD-binding region protein [Paraburkholderia piptadeniae]|uniref:Ferredoxin:oxidoreductase FAD/NAD(P)-binding:oxidoreductase FAD-binding region protein n=1 Tax=Paraburkholderia piptadeniae TaxID=1701573 RepID=A0A1N7SLV5_9BURK|nr:2Fe-2S iron-sulfur cluster-binding protein [Paraburkholderia piptadeniae]SIT48284.1 Ferredoxin:oxidoreductase FAD/NAD(P)-binding:oxidoreductase FAD-binding region protein [Paraburkholderia piptadeniae]